MSQLFTPIVLRGLTVPNRLWVAPMCQYSVTAEDGVPNDWHHVHLAQFANGRAGLVLTEATAVVPEGRISPQDTGIWTDEQRDAWRTITDAVHARGGLVGVQLAHAGRKASTWAPGLGERGTVPEDHGGWQTVAPSAIAYEGYAEPAPLDEAGIAAVVEGFRAGARRAVDAGFDAIEVHAAHGYLLHQFLSPLSNQRTDRWGGSLENRARLTIEVVRAVRAEVGEEFPVLVRFSARDAAPGGLEVDDVAHAATLAKEAGADFFDVSSAGLVKHQQLDVHPGYQVPYATAVRTAADAPVGAVGLITDPIQAETIVQTGQADVVLVAREFLRDPYFATRAAAVLGEPVRSLVPLQYTRAYSR